MITVRNKGNRGWVTSSHIEVRKETVDLDSQKSSLVDGTRRGGPDIKGEDTSVSTGGAGKDCTGPVRKERPIVAVVKNTEWSP